MSIPGSFETRARTFRTGNAEHIDSFSHAVRTLLRAAFNQLGADVDIEFLKEVRESLPSSNLKKKEILVTPDLYDRVRNFEVKNATTIDSSAEAVRILMAVAFELSESELLKFSEG